MALIEELTTRIATELHRKLDEAVRQAVESYVVGERQHRGRSRKSRSARTSRENRSQTIIDAVANIDAVAKLGEASIEDVAEATGLDKRGIGSSLHYLAEAGKLRHAGAGKYRTTRAHRAA